MEVADNNFTEFLKSKKFSVLVEKIVSIYSSALLKKIQDVEEQLKNVVISNQNLIENFTKNQNVRDGSIAGLSDYGSKTSSIVSNLTCYSTNESIINIENKRDPSFSAEKKINDDKTTDLICEVGSATNSDCSDTNSTCPSERLSETSSALSTVETSPEETPEAENPLFDKKMYIKNISLSKKDYSRSLVLGICKGNSKNNKVVFESQRKRFWIHLDNCKPRSRSEKTVITRLEDCLPGNV